MPSHLSAVPSPETAEPQQDVARLAVKSKPITTVGDARLVSKSFALRFLRKAFVAARIQRVDTPAGTKLPDNSGLEHLGPIETWQVWATGTRGKQGIVEVTAPREMLPFAVVREAFRCRLQMDVIITPIKGGGVNLRAEPLPPPPEVVQKLDEIKKEIEAQGGTVTEVIDSAAQAIIDAQAKDKAP